MPIFKAPSAPASGCESLYINLLRSRDFPLFRESLFALSRLKEEIVVEPEQIQPAKSLPPADKRNELNALSQTPSKDFEKDNPTLSTNTSTPFNVNAELSCISPPADVPLAAKQVYHPRRLRLESVGSVEINTDEISMMPINHTDDNIILVSPDTSMHRAMQGNLKEQLKAAAASIKLNNSKSSNKQHFAFIMEFLSKFCQVPQMSTATSAKVYPKERRHRRHRGESSVKNMNSSSAKAERRNRSSIKKKKNRGARKCINLLSQALQHMRI